MDNPVTAVASTADSKRGLTALVVVALLAVIIENKTGFISGLLGRLPFVGGLFVRKAS